MNKLRPGSDASRISTLPSTDPGSCTFGMCISGPFRTLPPRGQLNRKVRVRRVICNTIVTSPPALVALQQCHRASHEVYLRANALTGLPTRSHRRLVSVQSAVVVVHCRTGCQASQTSDLYSESSTAPPRIPPGFCWLRAKAAVSTVVRRWMERMRGVPLAADRDRLRTLTDGEWAQAMC